jgi:TRAP-type C4-dicarboxylate transport system permease small subunit
MLGWFIGRLLRGCELVSVAIGIWLSAVLVINVVCRYVLNNSLYWVDETSALLLVCLMLAVAPIGFHENFHVSMGIVVQTAPRRVRRVLIVLINLCTIVFFAIAGWYGVLTALAEADTPLFSVPIMRGWVTWVLPASSAIVILVCTNHILMTMRGRDLPPPGTALIK